MQNAHAFFQSNVCFVNKEANKIEVLSIDSLLLPFCNYLYLYVLLSLIHYNLPEVKCLKTGKLSSCQCLTDEFDSEW